MQTNVNERVKMLRTSIGSQNDFANMLGISALTVLRWEKGHSITKKSLQKINQVFGTSLEWLEHGTGEMEVNIPEQEVSSNPWREEAYGNLKEEISFLKGQIQMMRELLRVHIPQANFNDAFGIAGRFIGIQPIMSAESVSKVA